AFGEEAAGQDVVGRALERGLQLGLRGLGVPAVQEGAAEGDAGRGVVGVPVQALAADADGLRQLALLAQLFCELGEQARLLVEPPPELVYAGVAGQRVSRRRKRSQTPW